jgi:adenylyltransferase/sulfurtransferase
MIDFSEEQIQRYSRHILLKDIGVEGQIRIRESKILVIGAGGLGAPALLYLAAAGVGRLGFVDGDVVDLSNLQRQVIHSTPDVGIAKVESAAAKLKALNPDVELVPVRGLARADNGRELVRGWDFVIDGTDNFAAKFLINDACVLEKVPFSHGGILRFTGQTMTVVPGVSACYRCAFHQPPPPGAVPTCSEAGVLGAIAGMLGTIQAAEALKYVAKVGTPLTNALLTFEALAMDFRKVRLKRRSDCPVCGEHPVITELHDEALPVCDLPANRGGHRASGA